MHVTQCVLMETIKGSEAILFALASKNACDPVSANGNYMYYRIG